MKLRSIELVLPGAEKAAGYLTDIWGAAAAPRQDNTYYIRGSGTFPYLVALEEGEQSFVRSVTFVGSKQELNALKPRISQRGLNARPEVSRNPGGGEGFLVELEEGQILRFLANTTEVDPIEGNDDLPVKLTHVVLNAVDAERSADLLEEVLDFTVSDRTKGMVFIRCNEFHHSTAMARAGFCSLNHIAFEMQDLEAVMRGIGRLRDHGEAPAWGPGRHGPGDNVFAYFIAPFGAVVEFSTAVNKVPADYPVGAPEDWTWPENRIDQWGISDKDFEGLKIAEQTFRFVRDWQSQALV